MVTSTAPLLFLLSLYPSQVSALLAEVSEPQVAAHVARLAGEEPAPLAAGDQVIASRSVFHPDVALAEDYLAESLEGWGYTVRRHAFEYQGQTLANVEATHPGEELPDTLVLLVAHYDSTASADPAWDPATDPAPGADDNASSCAAVLEVARVLARARLRRTVRLVLFSAEEVGLVGSERYVAEILAGAEIRTFLNLDPVGNTGYFADTLFATYDAASEDEARRMEALVDAYDLTYPIVRIPGDSTTMPDNRSDHFHLWEAGFVGVHAGTPSGTINHTMADTADVVDSAFVAGVTRASLAFVVEAAEYLDHGAPPTPDVPDPNDDPKDDPGDGPEVPDGGEPQSGCAAAAPPGVTVGLLLVIPWAWRRRRRARDVARGG